MTYNSPEDFIEAIRNELNRGNFNAAQQLSFPAVERYPDHEVIKKLAYLLAPSKITVDREPPSTDLRANREWIKDNRMQYRGQWVAIKDGQLLAQGKNIDELVEQVGDIKNKGIFVTAIY